MDPPSESTIDVEDEIKGDVCDVDDVSEVMVASAGLLTEDPILFDLLLNNGLFLASPDFATFACDSFEWCSREDIVSFLEIQ